jgi:hypothetical protein
VRGIGREKRVERGERLAAREQISRRALYESTLRERRVRERRRGTRGLKVRGEGADIEESIVREYIAKRDAHILERLYELQASLDILGAL